MADLRRACSTHGIQVILAPEGADSVAVDGGTVNIRAFRAARDAGFVFAEQGRQSVFNHYPPQGSTKSAAGSYFGISL